VPLQPTSIKHFLNADLAALASKLGLAKNKPTKQKPKVVRDYSATSQSLSFEEFKVYKAKAEAFDRKNRKSQSKVKQVMQSELEKYGRCAYCETKMKSTECHIDLCNL
jgi:hypothetical protein